MIKLRRFNWVVTTFFLGITVCIGAMARRPVQQSVPASTDDTSRGINFYQQGQNEEAIITLSVAVKRDKRDLRAWHYLGLALEKQGDKKEARKAHEKAASLGEKLLNDQINQIRDSADFSRLLRPHSLKLMEAGESAQRYIQLDAKPSRAKLDKWSVLADSLREAAAIGKADPNTQTVFMPPDVDVKARILSKTEPMYTNEARREQVSGIVVLRAILAANGKIIAIHPVKPLSHGLTEEAIKAARQIKFIPAVKNGKPVSVYVEIEYSFDIY